MALVNESLHVRRDIVLGICHRSERVHLDGSRRKRVHTAGIDELGRSIAE